jgi:hypothetical protein
MAKRSMVRTWGGDRAALGQYHPLREGLDIARCGARPLRTRPRTGRRLARTEQHARRDPKTHERAHATG